jgi:N-acetylglutamate synthase-like GNAT family acetyltransferase
MSDVEVRPATDEALAAEVAQVINDAYGVGEAGLWRDGVLRTTAEQMAERIRAGEVLVATTNGRVVGCASVRRIDETTTEVGLISTRLDSWGGGVGSKLVQAAEDVGRSRGATTMQLKVLVPLTGPHSAKERLSDWYRRLGYAIVESLPFEQVASPAASDLATPCEFLLFNKPLR